MNLFPVFSSTSGISAIINYAIDSRSCAIRPNMQNIRLKSVQQTNKPHQNRTRRSGEIEKSLWGKFYPPPGGYERVQKNVGIRGLLAILRVSNDLPQGRRQGGLYGGAEAPPPRNVGWGPTPGA
jgi:hypothetical protein